jgi:dihydrofolate reductase
MELALIVAHDPDLLIGREGALPWSYPEDLAYFRRVTLGHPVIMGRIVFEEIGCRPLPGRRNVVLSRTRTWPEVDVDTCRSLDEALRLLEHEDLVFIIGGRALYEEALPKADQLYVTLIHKKHEGDVRFPEYRHTLGEAWIETSREKHPELTFLVYRRRNP